MNKPSFDEMRSAMVDSQLRTTGVNDMRVVEAFAAVPRERFVPAERAMLAYLDEDQPIGGGRYIMEPMAFGQLLMGARIAPHERVLIVGAGSGYAAAVIAPLASHVVALEQDAALAEQARGNLTALGVENARVAEGPLTAGSPEDAPYDLIFLDGAVEVIPEALLAQLKDGGRVVGALIDEAGVQRAVTGVMSAGSFGTVGFADISVARLPGFERPKRFTF